MVVLIERGQSKQAGNQGQRRLHFEALGVTRLPLLKQRDVVERQPGRLFRQVDIGGRPREGGAASKRKGGQDHGRLQIIWFVPAAPAAAQGRKRRVGARRRRCPPRPRETTAFAV